MTVDGSAVLVTLTAAGGAGLTDVTTHLAGLTDPANQLALVVNGLVRGAPTVADPVVGSMLAFGAADEAGAEELAGGLVYGTSLLPLTLRGTDG